ncbi:MAG: hypothetical protein ACI9P5_003606 [Saprospiraceae bacterium]|jgi:hypothetical protein|tara:strand:- start:357 stop:872 length:516 start_codon:yes stop_codon:yes gene_type:complete
MKYIFILLLLVICQSSFAQKYGKISIFHRLVINNSENEVMVVNLKDTDVWETPGFYQDSVQFTKEGLHEIAMTYGMKISNPELSGMFSTRREIEDKREMLIRNIYHSNYLSGEIHFPENQPFQIGEIKWLPIEEALSLISFESIRMFIKPTYDFPNVVWGGSIAAIREDDK